MSGSHRAVRTKPPRPTNAEPSAAGPASGGRAQARRGRRRKARRRRRVASAGTTVLLIAAAVGWLGFGPGGAFAAHRGAGTALGQDLVPLPAPVPSTAATPSGSPQPSGSAAADHTEAPTADRSDRADGSFAAIPGLGPGFAARIPAGSTQVVLATGAGKDATSSTVTLWSRTPDGRWRPGTSWSGHNGDAGWTTDHSSGDLRSPIGVFTLSDAGGLKPDPGSKLPYHQDSGFVATGTGFNGEQLAGSFDYVVAIDYNRVIGSSPLDTREPLGEAKGGGIWLHVDHGGPTHACVSVSEDDMTQLIRTLDPAAQPVIVMGDAASLAT
ncbi:L,D-peptidoglycan transpeptidase YkuD (ErfK/YbiS/YcfS/YnhG family) [Kitasatospora sp. GAS204A]|uniref:L,D-transpeptidase family protein n=1 Tax=Kitasatospora sp. GAS204B TaxID=3035283 RepID=UPI00247B5C2E|nr:L,D-peptidoglycan transpeptidase YkuD (ErfK/YbiS/YcfS/YnhG family) [Kitasatospora sp. GAS204B]